MTEDICGRLNTDEKRVIGIGDNVCDKYYPSKIMYPGGQAMNFSVYAKNWEQMQRIWEYLERIRLRRILYIH